MNRQRREGKTEREQPPIKETVVASPGKKKGMKASMSVASTAPSSMGRTQSKWMTSLARQNFIYFAEKLQSLDQR